MATLGRIFNIQRFSIHDGPGIRTIVFFKGCPMRCAWCCNPESQSFEIEEMYEAGKLKTVGRDVTVADVMPEILADLPYYRRSGGGVTLSGGEVLCQSTFAAELLSECKSAGLHTAIESAATLSYDKIERLLPYLDLYLSVANSEIRRTGAHFSGHRAHVCVKILTLAKNYSSSA